MDLFNPTNYIAKEIEIKDSDMIDIPPIFFCLFYEVHDSILSFDSPSTLVHYLFFMRSMLAYLHDLYLHQRYFFVTFIKRLLWNYSIYNYTGDSIPNS